MDSGLTSSMTTSPPWWTMTSDLMLQRTRTSSPISRWTSSGAWTRRKNRCWTSPTSTTATTGPRWCTMTSQKTCRSLTTRWRGSTCQVSRISVTPWFSTTSRRYYSQRIEAFWHQYKEKMHGNAVVFRSIRVVAVVWVFYFQNYTAIVDYDKRSCYIMKLDRVKVTPPKDWIDLIQKFAVSLLSQAPLPPFQF